MDTGARVENSPLRHDRAMKQMDGYRVGSVEKQIGL